MLVAIVVLLSLNLFFMFLLTATVANIASAVKEFMLSIQIGKKAEQPYGRN